MTDLKIEAASDARLAWGESACWDEESERLFFVDCVSKEICAYDVRRGRESDRQLVVSLPTALYLTTTKDRLLVQLDDGLNAFDIGRGKSELAVPLPSGEIRFNDGIADRNGNILTGSLLFGPSGASASGSYWRYSPTSGWRKLHQGKGNTNGPCFSPDGEHLYIADSSAGLIYRFAYAEGGLGDETVFADVRNLGGVPDGATVDSDGCLWTTICGGSCIAQFTPRGRLERTITLPASHPTSIAFAGSGLEDMWVTTISSSQFGFEPEGELSGALLRIEGLGSNGQMRSRCPF